jgi:concentrative nucleoside transporter, CNT family
MANFLIEQFGYLLDMIFGITTNLSLDIILGWIFSPLAWVMGVPWADCETVGRLLGEKMAINEFVAYASLANLLESGAQLHERSIVIATYALCGFANFSSIAIQIGGIGGIAPKRRHDLARIGFKAMIGGTLAAFMTGTIAGIFM